MDEAQPLKAWLALMQHLNGLSPPGMSFSENVRLPEEAEFAKTIWEELEPGGERSEALRILDEELDLDKRAWHLTLIPNRDLISHYQDQGELLWAFEAVIKELKENPMFREEGKQIAGEIWRNLPTELRRQRARNMVDDLFGTEGLSWQIELDILSERARHRYRLDQAVELSFEEPRKGTSPPNDRILPLNPDDPESAALGISL